jgi:2-keto-4-pentenoate hydratase
MSKSPTFQQQEAAQALREAREQRRTIPRISETFDIAGIEAAYAVAEINVRAGLDSGRRIAGKKVGLTSRSVQQQLGVDQPDFGMLFTDMEFLSGQELPSSSLIQPKVEAEIAFVVGHPLDIPAPTWSEFLASLAYALPAIEVVDSVIKDWKITLVDTVADNASSGLYVLGDQPVGIGALSMAGVGMQMDKNGETVSIGGGAACLGHPLRAAYWLAKTMAERGQGLRAGEVILSGALGPMVSVAKGDLIQVRIGGLGDVSCRMA